MRQRTRLGGTATLQCHGGGASSAKRQETDSKHPESRVLRTEEDGEITVSRLNVGRLLLQLGNDQFQQRGGDALPKFQETVPVRSWVLGPGATARQPPEHL
jgi:hypothetical protein